MPASAFSRLLREPNFLSLAANLSIAFFGFAGFALLARTYTIGVFGEWVLYVSASAFIEMFRFGITNTAVIRYLSGASATERVQFIGSNGVIGVVATFAIMIVLYLCLILFPDPIDRTGYGLFFRWYPLLALVNLPLNTALVIMQAEMKFGSILLLRLISNGGFFLLILMSYLLFELSLTQLAFCQIGLQAFTSAICIGKGWDGLRHIKKASHRATRTLLNFGKYTTFTLIGTNLLRSADTFIISLSPMGTTAVALYSIPLKLTELQQIPLRSFVATAFPKMSKASLHGKIQEVKSLFYTYSGALFWLFIPASLITFTFAGFFVYLLGGEQYLAPDPATGANAILIMQIFSLYGLLLPVDRMTGVGLDSINQPGKNFLKVLFMVMINIAGDLVAVFVFRSLELVAAGSVLFTLAGVGLGYFFLDKPLDLKFSLIFTEGIRFYKEMFLKLSGFLTGQKRRGG